MGYSQAAFAPRQDIMILPGSNALAMRLVHLIYDAADDVGIDRALIEVVQGSYNPGGVEASGTTHADGGAYDLRLKGISDAEAVEWCIALRERGSCAWPRIPSYGWNKGRHVHAIDRFEPDLSRSAQWQVSEYDAHRNALSGSSSAPDPIPHPKQTKYEHNTEVDVALTDQEIQKIAEAVWALKALDPITGDRQSHSTVLVRTRITSKSADVTLDEMKANPPSGGVYSLSEDDKDDIASRVADLLAIRLKG